MFHQTSYEKHRALHGNAFDLEKMNSWKNKNTVDYWRHKRMYENLDPFIVQFPEASWLTVGDGRYGTDANYILSKGAKNVLAVDISDAYLKIAKEEKFITDYKVENAESMSFPDDSFDFALCKEAYHHFPRPMIAVYEMLRVSRNAVIFIEPNDYNIWTPTDIKMGMWQKSFFRLIKDKIKKIIGRDIYYHFGSYETAGNYIYTLSVREVEKVALGLNLPAIAFKGFNDIYIEGVEYEMAEEKSELFKTVKQKIHEMDRLCERGKMPYGALVTVIFKKPLSEEMMDKLKKANYTVRMLPRNPYSPE